MISSRQHVEHKVAILCAFFMCGRSACRLDKRKKKKLISLLVRTDGHWALRGPDGLVRRAVARALRVPLVSCSIFEHSVGESFPPANIFDNEGSAAVGKTRVGVFLSPNAPWFIAVARKCLTSCPLCSVVLIYWIIELLEMIYKTIS